MKDIRKSLDILTDREKFKKYIRYFHDALNLR